METSYRSNYLKEYNIRSTGLIYFIPPPDVLLAIVVHKLDLSSAMYKNK